MATPKDYIVYIDKDTNKTMATTEWSKKYGGEDVIKKAGHKVIGIVSSGTEKDAIIYGDQVLR